MSIVYQKLKMVKVGILSLYKGIFGSLVSIGRGFVCKEVLVLGDSHARVFNSIQFKLKFPFHSFKISTVVGATVSGLQNPNSKTQALPIFMDKLNNSDAGTGIVLLGEVDTGFVLWYRAEKHNVPVEDMLDRAIENYQSLLKAVSKTKRVICISTPLPTIQDNQDWGEIASARKSVKASQLQRTELTLLFNKRMQEFCESNDYIYLSFDEESLGENGLVSKHLLNSFPKDHHYDTEKYAEMIVKRLKGRL